MTKRTPTGPIILRSQTARQLAASWCMQAPDGHVVSFREPKHSDAQRAKMNAMADDLSEQVQWCGLRLTKDEWKRFATAKLKKDKIVFDCNEFGQPDANAGLIVLGASTKETSGRVMGEIIDWFEWFGAQHGVVWGDEAKKVARLEQQRAAQPREEQWYES